MVKEEEEEERRRRVWRNPLEEIPKLDIYFHMNDKNWYSIKNSDYSSIKSETSTSSRRTKKVVLEPELPRLPDHIQAPTYASIGSKIYASGGLDRSDEEEFHSQYDEVDFKLRNLLPLYIPPTTNKVFYFDTLHPEDGWKAAPPMKVERYRHMMVADAGKIYVLGGLKLRRPPISTDATYIFAEVYDPSDPSGGWKPLACLSKEYMRSIDLPQTMSGHAVVKDGPFDPKILFYSYYTKSVFYLCTDRQDCGIYDGDFGLYHPSSSAFVDGVFYFLDSNRMYAYDVSTFSGKDHPVFLRRVGTNTLPHYEGEGESLAEGELQSLGNGYLALVWAKAPGIKEFVDVDCSIIKMSREGNSFVGVVLSCSTYSVKKGRLTSLMVVCAREEEDVRSDAEGSKNTARSGKQLRRKRRWDDVGSLTALWPALAGPL